MARLKFRPRTRGPKGELAIRQMQPGDWGNRPDANALMGKHLRGFDAKFSDRDKA